MAFTIAHLYAQAKRKVSEEKIAAPVPVAGRQGSSETEELANVISDPAENGCSLLDNTTEELNRGDCTDRYLQHLLVLQPELL